MGVQTKVGEMLKLSRTTGDSSARMRVQRSYLYLGYKDTTK